MWRTKNANGTRDVVDDDLGCGRRHLSVNVSYPIKRVLTCVRWISHGQLFTSEPWKNQRKLVTCVTDSISHKHSMGLHWAWRFKMLNRVSANEFIMLLKIVYHGRTVWGHSKMEKHFSWWRHQMDTFSALPALCERNPPVTDGFPSQRPGTRSFDVFFDLRLNKRLSKQSKRRWFETPSRSLLHNCNVDPDGDPSPLEHLFLVWLWTYPENFIEIC